MRLPFLISLVVAIVVGGIAWYRITERVCPTPLAYRIESIDGRFGLPEAKAKEHLAAAEKVWEDQVGRDLFYYDDEAELVVDFMFDERQAKADSEVNNRTHLDEMKAQYEKVFEAGETLKEEYDELNTTYEKRAASYEARLAEYNQKVTAYNDRGGAPSEVFEELEREKTGLNTELANLNSFASELRDLAKKMNDLGEEGNILVEEYNRGVEGYNKKFGYSEEFTQGDYQHNRINIYKFSNERELVGVLAHEFGHALGIGHVEGDSSVMYYLLEDTSSQSVLSEADMAAFVTLCGDGNEIPHQIRRSIRNILAIIS
jgi:hypothetical protein